MVISVNIFFLSFLNLYIKGSEINNEPIDIAVNNITFEFSALFALELFIFRFKEIVLFGSGVVM